MIHPSDLYVCLPAYNEASVLGEVIRNLLDAGYPNVAVVDDGSSDGTAEVARMAGAYTISHPINRGAGAAVQTAIELARLRGWKYILFMDADGQHVISDVARLCEKMSETDCDLVIGSRFLDPSPGIPRSRRIFNAIGNQMTNLFCKQNYTDTQSGLRLLNHRAIRQLELRIDGFGFCSEMIHQAEASGLDLRETPISVLYTDYSQSKGQDLPMGFTTAIHFLWNLFFRA
ncbi:glycosyltransferase family 2 protein [Lewinella sp. 4G2]|uniref:glycosyltransferase family 2 protein n=1 Tax=Lewinella sp. 4G2 TaxID=1803372 RepID=UPI0007B4CF10|nr:glycosyltransferase family 2 protein [Lewinella sp. 4G2]OAV44845.1 hypothetical protein A3850_010235 [Lewinella sp. 4G2]